MPELSIGDVVELTDGVDAAPAGAQEGVTDILDGSHVIVEVTSLPLEPILERIIVASPGVLRLVKGKRTRI
ncbi:MAG: hypothetical protein ACRDLL_12310 [Solirubrobacterales bacterium]